VRWALIGTALLIITVLIVIPVVNVFYQALKKGSAVYLANLFDDADTLAAIKLTSPSRRSPSW
jgi:sulfate transport system permease protein